MSRPKGSKNRPKNSISEQKTVPVSVPDTKSSGLCMYLELCQEHISKTGFNHTCFNPGFCLNKFEGKCQYLIARPKETIVSKETPIVDGTVLSVQVAPIKRGRGRPRKIK